MFPYAVSPVTFLAPFFLYRFTFAFALVLVLSHPLCQFDILHDDTL
jgi:hypothetical protein